MVARESIWLRRLAGGRRGGIVDFSGFLANPRVTVEALIASWGEEIAEACAGRHVGGWDGYPKSKPPGPITFRHGPEYFQSIARGWKLRDV
jgi:hypothetical protein